MKERHTGIGICHSTAAWVTLPVRMDIADVDRVTP